MYIYLSEKYCVATSPIGSLDKTTLAPEAWIFANLSYKICHSASTIFWYSDTLSTRTCNKIIIRFIKLYLFREEIYVFDKKI